MKTADLIGGGTGIALGCFVLYEGSKMPADLIMKIGPSYFPNVLAMVLIIFSLILIVYALLGRSKGHADPIRLGDKGIQRALISLLAIVAYAVFLDLLGYPVVTVLLVSGIMMLLGKRNPLQIACVSVATTFVVWLLFAKLLMLSMPMGILEDLI